MKVEFNCVADENGVVDGVALAQELMDYAARLITPYVAGCPGCLCDVFSHLGNKTLNGVYDQLEAGDPASGVLLAVPATDDPEGAISDALEEGRNRIALMIRGGPRHTSH